MKNKYLTLKVRENKKLGQYVKFPKQLLKQLNWKEGDKIDWLENKDGSFTLKKV